MSSTHCLAVLLFPAIFIRETAGQSRQAPDTNELVRLEQVWNEAHLRGDAAALDQLWANNLVVTVPSMAPMTKREALAFARSGRMHFEQYQTSDLRFRVYGDSAIVTRSPPKDPHPRRSGGRGRLAVHQGVRSAGPSLARDGLSRFDR